MTKNRDLGQVLALGGAAITIIAVIAGFVLVGGPGDARDRRLDEMTMRRINDVVGVVQCAFNVTGVAPERLEAARATRSLASEPGSMPELCGRDLVGGQISIGAGENPTAPGDVTYKATGATRIKICGRFRVASNEQASVYGSSNASAYPKLDGPRLAGLHCFELDLIKAGELAIIPNNKLPPAAIP